MWFVLVSRLKRSLFFMRRLEKVNVTKIHSQAKILGTIVTVGGAMLMTVVKGPLIPLPWANPNDIHQDSSNSGVKQDLTKGALLIAIGCICWAGFINLQVILKTKSYILFNILETVIYSTKPLE